jgi:dTMP kinase
MRFFLWVQDLEFKILEIPKPDLNVVLHVPAKIAQQLVDLKTGAERAYTKGKSRDLHESNLAHLKRAEQVYLELSRIFPKQFNLLECSNGKMLKPIDQVGEQIWTLVKKKLGFK